MAKWPTGSCTAKTKYWNFETNIPRKGIYKGIFVAVWGKDNFALLRKKQTYLAVEEVSYLRTSHCVHQALLRQFISFCHVFRQTEKKSENVVFYVPILLYHRVNKNLICSLLFQLVIRPILGWVQCQSHSIKYRKELF
jgi:hypothetical protein